MVIDAGLMDGPTHISYGPSQTSADTGDLAISLREVALCVSCRSSFDNIGSNNQ
jgi:hypothetical protein